MFKNMLLDIENNYIKFAVSKRLLNKII